MKPDINHVLCQSLGEPLVLWVEMIMPNRRVDRATRERRCRVPSARRASAAGYGIQGTPY